MPGEKFTEDPEAKPIPKHYSGKTECANRSMAHWVQTTRKGSHIEKDNQIRLGGALAGTAGSLVLVLLFRSTQSPVIYRFFTSADRLAFMAASTATSWLFPGDRIHRGVSIATFFDIVLVLVTGLQCAFLGLCAGLLLGRTPTTHLDSPTMR